MQDVGVRDVIRFNWPVNTHCGIPAVNLDEVRTDLAFVLLYN